MKINIVGDVFGESGYARHTRNLIIALTKEGVEVGTECAMPQGWEFNCPDEVLKAVNTSNRLETTIYVGQPQFWPSKLSDRPDKFIGFLVFEGDKLPEGWKEICNRKDVDLIFVPSKHTKDACTTSGVDKNKIKVIPHGVDTHIFRPAGGYTFPPGQETSPTKFLFVGGWAQGENDRKNLPFLLRAYCNEFTKEDNVEMVVKINPVYNQPGFDFEQAINAIGLPENHPPIKLNAALLPDEEIAKMYNECDVFVCPSKAEAFGLIYLEAMACGKPCIAGDYGGQTDFINENNGWLLKGKLDPSKDMNPIYEDINWAKYDSEELKKLMRKLYNNQKEIEQKGHHALNEAIKWTWKSTAKKILNVVTALTEEQKKSGNQTK